MISTTQLADLFVHIADALVDDFDVVELLHTLTVSAAELAGAQGAGLILLDQRGNQQLMAASDILAADLERLQLRHQEGPCIDCLSDQRRVINLDIHREQERWTSFAPAALGLGLRMAHAFPMRLRNEAVGAFNLFATSTEPMTSETARVIQALADVATISILQERAAQRAGALTEQLQGALNSRIVVEQAKGAVAQLAQVDVDTAFEILRQRSRVTHTKLVDVAREVLEGSYDHIPGADGRGRSV